MLIPVTDLRNGTIFKENEAPYQVLKYSHTKMGRGLANIKVKVKNLKTGTITEKTFNSGMKVAEAEIERKAAQYLFVTENSTIFMDPVTYEQAELSKKIMSNASNFLKQGDKIYLIFYEGEVIGLELPLHVLLSVTYAEKGFKGDTASSVFKPVKLETGIEVQVPLFIKTGDVIKVDTRTGEYVERAK